MKLLRLLLGWPPGPATVGVALLLTVLGAATMLVFGGVADETTDENATIESTDLTVRLNDDVDFPETDGVATCMAVGTPGDSVSVLGDVAVDVPADSDRGRVGDRRLTVVVSLARIEQNTTATVTGTGRETADVFWIFEDDETLSVGDTARLQVRLRSGESTLAEATRTVSVENGSRSYDC